MKKSLPTKIEEFLFNSETEKTIENIDEVIELINIINLITLKDNNKFFFRGQATSEWKLISSLRRFMEKKFFEDENDVRKFSKEEHIDSLYELQEEILNEYAAKTVDHFNKLGFLANMQHYGIPTFFIDFTSDIFHALWFAISEIKNTNKTKYFSLYIIKSKDIKNEVELNKEKFEIFKAPNSISRSLSQKSYFIIDNNSIDKNYKKINISSELEIPLLEFLLQKNISASTIYPDEKGFFYDFINNSLISYFLKGNLNKYNSEISKKYYLKAIEIDSNYLKPYEKLCHVYVELEEYENGKKCYEKLVTLEREEEIVKVENSNISFTLGNYDSKTRKIINDISKEKKYLEDFDKIIFNFIKNTDEILEKIKYYTEEIDFIKKLEIFISKNNNLTENHFSSKLNDIESKIKKLELKIENNK